MQVFVILQLLILLMLANGTPVIAKKLLGDRYSYPLDGNLTFADGRPLFGHSKTIRGVVLAVLVTTAGAPLIGLDWKTGLLVGSVFIAGFSLGVTAHVHDIDAFNVTDLTETDEPASEERIVNVSPTCSGGGLS